MRDRPAAVIEPDMGGVGMSVLDEQRLRLARVQEPHPSLGPGDLEALGVGSDVTRVVDERPPQAVTAGQLELTLVPVLEKGERAATVSHSPIMTDERIEPARDAR